MKVAISIPTFGAPDNEVEAYKAQIVEALNAYKAEGIEALSGYTAPVELVDTYIRDDAPVEGDRAGAWYLGESLKRLATADAVYFAAGWRDARGCRIERAVCEAYNIPILDADTLIGLRDVKLQKQWERNESGVDVFPEASP